MLTHSLNFSLSYELRDLDVIEAYFDFRKNPCFDFLSQEPHTSDAVLVIDGVKLHVSKTVRANSFVIRCALSSLYFAIRGVR